MQRPRVTLTFNYPCGCTRTTVEMGRDLKGWNAGIGEALKTALRWFDTRNPLAPCETGQSPPHPTRNTQAQTT